MGGVRGKLKKIKSNVSAAASSTVPALSCRSDRRKKSKELLPGAKTVPDQRESLAVGWNRSRRMETCTGARAKKKQKNSHSHTFAI